MAFVSALLKEKVSMTLWHQWYIRKKSFEHEFKYTPGWLPVWNTVSLILSLGWVYILVETLRSTEPGIFGGCVFFFFLLVVQIPVLVKVIKAFSIENAFVADCEQLIWRTFRVKGFDRASPFMHSVDVAKKMVHDVLVEAAKMVLEHEDANERLQAEEKKKQFFEPLHAVAMKFILVQKDWGVYFMEARDMITREKAGGQPVDPSASVMAVGPAEPDPLGEGVSLHPRPESTSSSS